MKVNFSLMKNVECRSVSYFCNLLSLIIAFFVSIFCLSVGSFSSICRLYLNGTYFFFLSEKIAMFKFSHRNYN